MKTEDIEIKKANVLIMFYEANTFKKEFDRKILETRTDKYRKSVHDEYPIPYCITLGTFACELFIKFLIGIDKIKENITDEIIKIPKGHDLNKLYDGLSAEFQRVIESRIEKELLKDTLTNNANAFRAWRYIYECKEDSIEFNYDEIKHLIDVLYEISDEKKNEIYFGADNCTDIIMFGTEINVT